MHLRCSVCHAIQPVTCPDEADEDVRTRAIRQAFRAEHQACGERTISLIFDPESPEYVEEPLPMPWAEGFPSDVTLGADGSFSRTITRDGVSMSVRVCEDCWQTIPRYVDFPFGLVSPDSDGDARGQGAKIRRAAIPGSSKRGIEHLVKAVCLPCYQRAFRRVYPEATLPALREVVIGDGLPIAPPPPLPEVFVGEPQGWRA